MVNQQILKKINNYYSLCKIKNIAHTAAGEKYKSLYIYTNSPIIVLSSLTTILASYNSNIYSQHFALITAVLSGIITISHALTSFLEFNVKYEVHTKISNRYMILAQTIENDFFIKYSCNPSEIDEEFIRHLFDIIHKSIQSILVDEPYLPSYIVNHSDIKSINDITKSINEELIYIDNTLTNPAPSRPMSELINNMRPPWGSTEIQLDDIRPKNIPLNTEYSARFNTLPTDKTYTTYVNRLNTK